MNGGAAVVRTLKQGGVTAIFALHGAHVDAIFQAAAQEGVRLVDMRHEAAAGHAAEGYARATRTLGVAVVTAGAGFTNIVSSIANAGIDRTPVLYIGGAPALGDAVTNTLQDGVDQVAVARPLVKWAHQINRAEDIPRLVAHAMRVATAPPMGPVFLNIPMDIGLATVTNDVAVPRGPTMVWSGHPDPAQIEAARALLASAERPVILAGSDAYYADAGAALLRFAETSGIPVFSDFAAHGLIPASHPLYGGTTHKLGYLDARPDLVLALGIRFSLFTLGRGDLLFGDAKLIHVESDAAELGKLRTPDIGIVAHPAHMLEALGPPAVDRAKIDRWAETVRSSVPARRERLDTETAGHNGPIHPWRAVSAIARAARDAILVADGAEAYHWLNEAIAQEHPGSYLTHGFLGCMGIGLGTAIGAQVAYPERRVLLMAGDGAIGFNIAEFDTMVRHGLPIVAVVMNNHSWGASQRFQEVFPAAERVIGTTLGGARYDVVAQGFGCVGVAVERIDDLAPAIAQAFLSGRPTCIDLRIDYQPMPPEIGLMMGGTP